MSTDAADDEPTRPAGPPAPLIVVGGPTATGKTAVALAIAEHLMVRHVPAEIVSADSRQVYRGLDIGTAKATAEERARVVHHGIDLVEPDEPFTVADFRRHALGALRDLRASGGVGILAGGTGLWLRSVVAGIDTDSLPHDPAVRAALEEAVTRHGVEALARRLRTEAPMLAARTDLRNPRRVVRALEVATLRGDGPLPSPLGYGAPVLGVQLVVEPVTHRGWIANRARAQFDAGLVEEARSLRERFDPGLPALSAIGYRESWAHLDGTLTRADAIDLDALHNAQFAKRQATWFRREPALAVVDATRDPMAELAPRVDAFLDAVAVNPA